MVGNESEIVMSFRMASRWRTNVDGPGFGRADEQAIDLAISPSIDYFEWLCCLVNEIKNSANLCNAKYATK